MIILDTNIISEPPRTGADSRVLDWLNDQEAGQLHLTTPTIAEMAKGAEVFFLKTKSPRHQLYLEHVVGTYRGRILGFDLEASRLFGRVVAQRQMVGRPISVMDAMIAAIAIAHGATLATRNARDFEGLDLKLANPFEAGA
jgi:toxin FitB